MAQEPVKETLEDEPGSGPEADLIGTEVVGVQEGYSSNGSGEEGAVAVTGLDPRLTLLWEWQCPLSPSTNLSTRVTCMAWNKVLHHLDMFHWAAADSRSCVLFCTSGS